jgi:hypothetical protein
LNAFSRFQKKPGNLVASRSMFFIIILLIPITIFSGMKIATLVRDNSLQKIIEQNRLVMTSTDFGYIARITLRNGGILAWIISISGLVYAALCKRGLLIPTVIWVFLQQAFYFIQVSIIGAAVSSLTNLIVILSIPLALLAANSVEAISGLMNIDLIRNTAVDELGRWLIRVSAFFFIMMGAYNISGIINPVTVLYNQNDLSAVEWIRNNTDQNTTFLVDAFLWGDKYMPSDGGSWLNNLSGRQIIFPSSPTDFANSASLIEEKGINYIYIGHGYGDLDSAQFESDSYSLVYQNRATRIYEVLSLKLVP